jgi:aconitase A
MGVEPPGVADLCGARVLAVLGDSVTTDHISPAGAIAPDSPAGRYLTAHGIRPDDFNSYGSWRGNHEVMVRGTFANVRLRNHLAPGTEGGLTRHLPGGGKRLPLEELRFHLVGYGCTTCIGNSGPLPARVSEAIRENDLVAVSHGSPPSGGRRSVPHRRSRPPPGR